MRAGTNGRMQLRMALVGLAFATQPFWPMERSEYLAERRRLRIEMKRNREAFHEVLHPGTQPDPAGSTRVTVTFPPPRHT